MIGFVTRVLNALHGYIYGRWTKRYIRPRSSRRISQEEAVKLIEAEHKRGHIQTAWFKDAIGGRFYALCNCCKCCCFGMEAMAKYAVPMIASSGYVAQVYDAVCEAHGLRGGLSFRSYPGKWDSSCELGDFYGVWSVCRTVPQ